MREPIVVPKLNCAAMVLSVWYVKPGEAVFTGDRVVELLLGAATFDITAPASGVLLEQSANAGEQLNAGQIVGYLDAEQAPG
jgi:pyruvate/2-oxoglutarate dehydrogenase complex dihydrolipoamide acyltransferase (E2) component